MPQLASLKDQVHRSGPPGLDAETQKQASKRKELTLEWQDTRLMDLTGSNLSPTALRALGELEHTLSTILAASAGATGVGEGSSTLDQLAFGSLAVVTFAILPVMHAIR